MKPVSVFLFFIFSATFIFAQSTKEIDSSVVFSPLKNIPKKEKLLKITNFKKKNRIATEKFSLRDTTCVV